MGVVYKARDPQLGRFVAIKMIAATDPGLVSRFYNEARSTASLQHPNIVTIYDFGDQDGSPFLVMQFLEGTSLESIISNGNQLTLVDKLNVCVDICSGLQYAHEQNIIHRDIKPANIMVLRDGTAVIVDFGIARLGNTGVSRTALIGSLHYMSPEQFRHLSIDFRSDLFSTGVLAYRLLTGALPFDAGDEASVMHQIVYETQPPLSVYIQDYPAELDGLIARALAKNRDERFLSAHDFGLELMSVRDRLKQTALQQLLQRAEAAIQRDDIVKAQELLGQVLRIDKNHLLAHRLLADLQSGIRLQQRSDRAFQLRTQADEAMLAGHHDQALRFLDEAISLDEKNVELRNFRETVKGVRALRAQIQAVLKRAETEQKSGDLDEAMRAIDEALRLDPNETGAQALRLAISAQIKEQTRKRQARSLLEEARLSITSGDITTALQTLETARALDPGSAELESLQRVAISAYEQRLRKEELDGINREIGDLLLREDYASVVTRLEQALQKFPSERGLLQLRELAQTQQQRSAQKSLVRSQPSQPATWSVGNSSALPLHETLGASTDQATGILKGGVESLPARSSDPGASQPTKEPQAQIRELQSRRLLIRRVMWIVAAVLLLVTGAVFVRVLLKAQKDRVKITTYEGKTDGSRERELSKQPPNVPPASESQPQQQPRPANETQPKTDAQLRTQPKSQPQGQLPRQPQGQLQTTQPQVQTPQLQPQSLVQPQLQPTQPSKESTPEPTDTFGVSPDTIEPGKSAQLVWETKNAVDVTIDGEKVDTKGSKSVSPTASSKYSLIAKGPGGTTRDEVFLNVRSVEQPKQSATRIDPVSAEDKAGIQKTLNRYADVFAKRKAKNLREIWPTVPSAKLSAIQSVIDSSKNFSVSLVPQKWELFGTGVLVTCQQTQSFERNGRPTSQTNTLNFYVVKSQGNWIISDIPVSSD